MPQSPWRYHVTPARSLPAIAREGLLPQIGPRSAELGETCPRIYLFASLDVLEDALSNWLGEAFKEDEPLTLLAVRAPETPVNGFECVVDVPIGPEHIRVLSANLDGETDLARIGDRLHD